METPNEILSLSETNRISEPVVTAHAELIIKHVTEGNLEAWKALAYCKYLTDLAAKIREGVMPQALKEIVAPLQYDGVTLKPKQTGVKFDYNSTNHPEYNKLSSEVIERTLKMKELQAFLSKLNKPIDMVDTETGEAVTVYPPKKSGTDIIEVSYNKPKL